MPRITRNSSKGSPKTNGVTSRNKRKKTEVEPIHIVDLGDSSETDSEESDKDTQVADGFQANGNEQYHDQEEEQEGNEEDDDDDEDGDFEVEAILGKQIDVDGNVYYLLKWKNWKGEPTWEPEGNCVTCTKLVRAYEKTIAKCQRDKAERLDHFVKGLIEKGLISSKKTKRKSAIKTTAKPSRKPTRLQYARVSRRARRS